MGLFVMSLLCSQKNIVQDSVFVVLTRFMVNDCASGSREKVSNNKQQTIAHISALQFELPYP